MINEGKLLELIRTFSITRYAGQRLIIPCDFITAPPPAPLQIDIDFINFNTIEHENFEFNINGSDVMVFLHIQKTGGTTFGKHLVQDIDLESPCLCKRRSKKRKFHISQQELDDGLEIQREKRKLKCDCFRPTSKTNWLFSRQVISIY